MASSYSVLALDAAGRLDRELSVAAGYLDDLVDLIRGDARASMLVQSIAAVVVTAQQLRRYVLNATRNDRETPVEVHERALRARMNIVMRALYVFKQYEREIPSMAFVARFRRLRDVSMHIVDQVAQIHQRWTKERRPRQPLDQATTQALAYAALDEAEVAFERLGRDDGIVHFLLSGFDSTSDEVAIACREVAATIGLCPRVYAVGTSHPFEVFCCASGRSHDGGRR